MVQGLCWTDRLMCTQINGLAASEGLSEAQATHCVKCKESCNRTVRGRNAAYFLVEFWPIRPRVQLVTVCPGSLGACS